jgi:diadenosine tetraphosphatase ApaH/serine/threonine PP2A family protein phosphatase
MKIAVISDIHSNLPALEVVLRRISELKADSIYCLGDMVGYGPFPNECIELIRTRCQRVVLGNHDAGLIGKTDLSHFNRYGQEAISWTKTVVTRVNADYLETLPFLLNESGVTIVHASPFNPSEWNYVLTMKDTLDCFGAFSERNCFIGHTHIPIVTGEDLSTNIFRPGTRHVINVGSVGQPRDRNPDAAFGILDTTEETYALHRVSYDVRRTSRAIKDAGLPAFLGKRLYAGV